MALFKVEMEPEAYEPDDWTSQGDCQIVARFTRFVGIDLVLIDTNPIRAHEISELPGVLQVDPVINDSFVSDDRQTRIIRDGSITEIR